MKLMTVLALLSIWGAPARAAWDESDVKDVLDTLPKGKGISETDNYPEPQSVSFRVDDLVYRIDLRAKLCFAHTVPTNALTTVPCKSLKEGYALMAPLITWE